MAFTVNFYTFSKKVNSTSRPTGNPALSITASLKDNSGVINPVLEIDMANNPYNLNYCYIPQFSRYYWVNDWTWILGRWEVTLTVDVLATYKTQIGNSTHYVLRSSYRYNPNIVDELYPVLSWQPNYYTDNVNFNWTSQIDLGWFILGVANNNRHSGFGAIDYYALRMTQIRELVYYMLPDFGSTWTNGFSGMTDSLYRSIYSPFDYIKSCKWIPLGLTVDGVSPTTTNIRFGNYDSGIAGYHILNNSSNWQIDNRVLYLPSSWLSLDAKYRTNPYAHLYIVFNPFGVIELNPLDFTDTRRINLYLYYDLITGNGFLKIYKQVGSTEYFITQKEAPVTIDIPLSTASIDARGIFNGLGGILTAGASALTATTGAGIALSAISAGASAGNMGLSMAPTINSSRGSYSGNIRTYEGNATLIYQSTYFADEDNTENGKPLCENIQLNTIPGFIKCLHGETAISGAYDEELNIINDNLTNGFFYE